MNRLVRLSIVTVLLAVSASGFAADRHDLKRQSNTVRRAPRADLLAAFRSLYRVKVDKAVLPPLPPIPEGGEGTGSNVDGELPAIEPISLYHCVKYEDLDNIHPCAVRTVVAVQDPCYDPRSCCAPACVYVEICVPPCKCRRVKVSRRGSKVEYDYGEYEVEIKSKRGVVYVDYDD